jgi:hypothetical protein
MRGQGGDVALVAMQTGTVISQSIVISHNTQGGQLPEGAGMPALWY